MEYRQGETVWLAEEDKEEKKVNMLSFCYMFIRDIYI